MSLKNYFLIFCFCQVFLQIVYSNNLLAKDTSDLPKIKSREYKVLLKADRFRGHLDQAIDGLTKELEKESLMVGAKLYGNFELREGMPRTVQYYDQRHSCKLAKNGWSFRLRREQGQYDWEGTLKTRSRDRYHSGFRSLDMNRCGVRYDHHEKNKFEMDINSKWDGIYSFSHKCNVPQGKNINNLRDITDIWVEMADVMNQLEWQDQEPLALVGDRNIVEMVYQGPILDFSKNEHPSLDEQGKLSLTLWYEEESFKPELVELSMSIGPRDDEGPFEAWKKHTIMTAHDFWQRWAKHPWNDPDSMTKTQWIYSHWNCLD